METKLDMVDKSGAAATKTGVLSVLTAVWEEMLKLLQENVKNCR